MSAIQLPSVILLLFLSLALLLLLPQPTIAEPTDSDCPHQTGPKEPLPEKVIATLNKKIELLKKYLNSRVVLNSISESNTKHKNITHSTVLELDRKWRSAKGLDDFIKSYLINPCSVHLLDLQDEDDSFVEVFITDKHGLNVCQTNKTSDLYQADEQWWKNCFAKDTSEATYGDIEYDESAGSEAISAYLPIFLENKVIGVCKAVIDVTSIGT